MILTEDDTVFPLQTKDFVYKKQDIRNYSGLVNNYVRDMKDCHLVTSDEEKMKQQ